ncbi:general odorant-binding protein 56a-like [Episyrphus balteatus]|uniref:general odorant-binding protein 56a-like n=1 Tax=Episyrphus balteatus TaxID=286459 RepID=UPI00248619D9|nr:general odorant-binding protein 56a-like [Episyrphus balteatus]
MKSIFVVVLLAAFAASSVLAGLTAEQAMEYMTGCKKDLNISDADLAQLGEAKTFDEVNENSKCFFNCFQTREGTLIDGVLQEDKVIELFESSVGEKRAREVFEICRKQKGAEKCETAFLLQNCYRENGIF